LEGRFFLAEGQRGRKHAKDWRGGFFSQRGRGGVSTQRIGGFFLRRGIRGRKHAEDWRIFSAEGRLEGIKKGTNGFKPRG